MTAPPIETMRRVLADADEALALWSEYKRTGDMQVRNRLVMTYAPLVKYIVFKKVRELPVADTRINPTVSHAGKTSSVEDFMAANRVTGLIAVAASNLWYQAVTTNVPGPRQPLYFAGARSLKTS